MTMQEAQHRRGNIEETHVFLLFVLFWVLAPPLQPIGVNSPLPSTQREEKERLRRRFGWWPFLVCLAEVGGSGSWRQVRRQKKQRRPLQYNSSMHSMPWETPKRQAMNDWSLGHILPFLLDPWEQSVHPHCHTGGNSWELLGKTDVREWKKRMRSSLVVRASDCQCTSCNSPGFDPSIRRHSGIWGTADEAVLNIVWKTNRKKSPQKYWKKKYWKKLLYRAAPF